MFDVNKFIWKKTFSLRQHQSSSPFYLNPAFIAYEGRGVGGEEWKEERKEEYRKRNDMRGWEWDGMEPMSNHLNLFPTLPCTISFSSSLFSYLILFSPSLSYHLLVFSFPVLHVSPFLPSSPLLTFPLRTFHTTFVSPPTWLEQPIKRIGVWRSISHSKLGSGQRSASMSRRWVPYEVNYRIGQTNS